MPDIYAVKSSAAPKETERDGFRQAYYWADGSYPMPVMTCGTLRACQILAASGDALQELASRKADPDSIRAAAILAAQKAG